MVIYLLLGCGDGKKTEQGDELPVGKEVKNKWTIASHHKLCEKSGLLNVESIVYDEQNDVFYVSNGLNYRAGTDGFISKVSIDGSMNELKWVDGLNRPTGMAVYDSILYVADFNRLIAIHTRGGIILDEFVEPVENSGLNDVAINHMGEVYVTASAVHSVYKLIEGELTQWLQDDIKLQWANGIETNDDGLLVAGMHLSLLDEQNGSIELVELTPAVQDFEGIAPDGTGGYFLTTVENSALFYLDDQLSIVKLTEDFNYFGDLAFIPEINKLFVPRGNHQTAAYYLSTFKMDK